MINLNIGNMANQNRQEQDDAVKYAQQANQEKSTVKLDPPVQETLPAQEAIPAQETAPIKTRSKGRPCADESKGKKRDYCKTINIAVPKDTLEAVNTFALPGRGLNLTDYINVLIKKDLEKNISKYYKIVEDTSKFD